MSKVSFEEIGEVTVTFYAKEGVKAGQMVTMSGNGEVGPCEAGDRFCGLATWTDGKCAAVQVRGFLTLPCSDKVTVGWNTLAADGKGGVTVNTEGGDYLVAAVDTTAGTAVVCL